MQQEDEGLTRRKNSYLDVLIKHHQPHSMQSREAQTGVLSLARRTEQDGGGWGERCVVLVALGWGGQGKEETSI